MTEQNILIKICLDIIALLLVGIPWIVVLVWAQPYERGYFPNDQSLSLPYKQEAISEVLLACLGFALLVFTLTTEQLDLLYGKRIPSPMDNHALVRALVELPASDITQSPKQSRDTVILIVEIIRSRHGKASTDKAICGIDIPGWVWDSYVAIGIFTFGAACQQLFVTVAKYAIGRLRPHFFNLCRPLVIGATAQGYVTGFSCASDDAAKLKAMRLSFPSAHAGFSMYCAVYFILYIQVKAKWRGSKLLRPVAQLVVLIAAWYVGLSRVVDHMHHATDVAAGFAIGALFALITFIFLYMPKKPESRMSWLTEPSGHPAILPRPVLMRHNVH